MFKIRNDRLGWTVSSKSADKEVQVSKTAQPLTIHFSEGVTIRTCPFDGGPAVDIQALEKKAHQLLLASSLMDV